MTPNNQLDLFDNKNIEIISGLTKGDIIVWIITIKNLNTSFL